MIARRPFGRTGHESSRLVFGAAALWRAEPRQSAQALERLLAHGVNHIDVAASYGEAEVAVGTWMARHRDDFFLATKTNERSYDGAREQIRRSLARLHVDRIDLLQLHNLVKPDEWEEALGSAGALRAALEARDEGRVRFIGVTGHGTRVAAMHARSLERFDFDSVLLPYNFSLMRDERYRGEFDSLCAACRERGVAIQTIKSVARRRWSEEGERARDTWYEPFESQEDIDRAVHWALANEDVFVNSAGDLELLPRILDAAERFGGAPPDEAMRESESRLGVEPLFIRGFTAA